MESDCTLRFGLKALIKAFVNKTVKFVPPVPKASSCARSCSNIFLHRSHLQGGSEPYIENSFKLCQKLRLQLSFLSRVFVSN